MELKKYKVVIIGAGMVGSATVSALLSLGMVAEIILIDENVIKARGEALDASHTTSFEYSPNVLVREGGYEECRDAQIIVMTAGPSAKPGGNPDRLALAATNVEIVKQVMTSISQYTQGAIIILVTNPVDIVTYAAQTLFPYPKHRIIGMGTMLDTARFKRILGMKYLIDTKNVQGYVLGEHGHTAFAAWSLVNIAGIPMHELNQVLGMDVPLDQEEIMDEVRRIGFEILQAKGFTNFGISTSVARLVKAILLNELSVLPVCTTLQGEYGISDVALSIPCVISSDGIAKTLSVSLSDQELAQLHHSADHLKTVIKQLQL